MTKKDKTDTAADGNVIGARRAARGFLAVAFVALAAAAVGGAEKSPPQPATSAAQPAAQITRPAAHSVIPAAPPVIPAAPLVIPATPPVIPAAHSVIPAAPPVIPAQAGIHLRDSGAFFTPRRKAGGGESAKALSGGGIGQKTPPATLPSANPPPPLALQAGGKKPVIPAANIADIGKHADILNGRFRWNDAVADIAGGLSFADYVRREQARLLFALDDALSQKAESVITENFAAVKKAQIDLQTELGGRKGNLGINLVGALAENQTNAFGWQLRVYAGQDSDKGFNAGFFYRHKTEESLIGANIFLDYEKRDINNRPLNFFRYSIGGEARHKLASFAANYYFPITGERRVTADVVAFQREGYDARVRLAVPRARYLRAALDYYNFEGRGDVPEEKGLRYGAEARLLPGLLVGVFYDGEADEVGGEFSYARTLGEHYRAHPAVAEYAPDLYAPVWREHSQRIALLTVALVISIGREIVAGDFYGNTYDTVAVISSGFRGFLSPDVDYDLTLAQIPGGGFSLGMSVLSYRLPGGVFLTMAVATVVAGEADNPAAQSLTLLFGVTATRPAAVAARMVGGEIAAADFYGNTYDTVAVISSGFQGLSPDADYDLVLAQTPGGGFSLGMSVLSYRLPGGVFLTVAMATVVAGEADNPAAQSLTLLFGVTATRPAAVAARMVGGEIAAADFYGNTYDTVAVISSGFQSLSPDADYDLMLAQTPGGGFSLGMSVLSYRLPGGVFMTVAAATVVAGDAANPAAQSLTLFFSVTATRSAAVAERMVGGALVAGDFYGNTYDTVTVISSGFQSLSPDVDYDLMLAQVPGGGFSLGMSVLSYRLPGGVFMTVAVATVVAGDAANPAAQSLTLLFGVTATRPAAVAARSIGGEFIGSGIYDTVAVVTSGFQSLSPDVSYDLMLAQVPGGGFSLGMGGVLLYRIPSGSEMTATATVVAGNTADSGAQSLSLFFNITVSQQMLAGAFGSVFIADGTTNLALLSSGFRGFLPFEDADYRYALVDAGDDSLFALSGASLRFEWFATRVTMVRTTVDTPIGRFARTVTRFVGSDRVALTLTATIAARDNASPARPTVSLFFRVTAVPSVVAAVDYEQRVYAAGVGDSLNLSVGSVAVAGGIPPYTYQLMQAAGQDIFQRSGNRLSAVVDAGDGLPSTYPPTARTVLATVRVNDASPLTPPVDVPVSVFAAAPVSVSVEYVMQTWQASTMPVTAFTVHLFGGYGVFSDGMGGTRPLSYRRALCNLDTNSVNLQLFASEQNPGVIRYRGRKLTAGNHTVRFRFDDDDDEGNSCLGTGGDEGDLTPPIQLTVRLTVTAAP